MQNLTEIPSSEKLVDSRARINNNFVSVQSNFSGTAFPTVSVEVGQTCFRTDLAQKFELKSVNPNVWILIADLTKTYTNKEYVDTQDALKMPKAGGTFTGSVYGLTPIKGATTKELATMEALADGLSDKADSADLADVATSGSYTDLADKPDFTVYYTKTEVDTAIPDLASQAEAEAGTDNARYLSSLRVKQAINALTSPHGQQMFTSSGTFTVPIGVTKVYITGCGGGGAGYYKTTNGNAGGATSFGTLLTLNGGGGGNTANGTSGGWGGEPANEYGYYYLAGSEASYPFYRGGDSLFGIAGCSYNQVSPTGYGAGGKGRNSDGYNEFCGGGAQCAYKQPLAVNPGQSYAITIGAGGINTASDACNGTKGFILVEW